MNAKIKPIPGTTLEQSEEILSLYLDGYMRYATENLMKITNFSEDAPMKHNYKTALEAIQSWVSENF